MRTPSCFGGSRKKMMEALKAVASSAELTVKEGDGHPWLTIFMAVRIWPIGSISN